MGIHERKEREFQRREQEILNAALELFTSDEWQTATIEQIAQRAEIGKGTVYKHFASKDEIYARLALDFQRRVLATLRGIDPTLGVLDKLREAIRCVFEAHRAMGPEHQRVLQYYERREFWKALSESTRGEIMAQRAEFDAFIGDIVQQGIDEGLFPRKPITRLTFGPEATVVGAIQRQWLRCDPTADPQGLRCDFGVNAEEYLEEITCFILAGMMHQDEVRAPKRSSALRASHDGREQHTDGAGTSASLREEE